MRRRTIVLGVAAVVVVGLVVAGLVWLLPGDSGRPGTGSRGGTAATGTATPGAPGATRPSTAPGGPGGTPGARGTPGGVPGGDAPNGFLNELGAIDPRLVADPERALRNGEATCQDIKASKPHDEVVREAMQRFRGPSVAISDVKATLIVDAARNHLCPG